MIKQVKTLIDKDGMEVGVCIEYTDGAATVRRSDTETWDTFERMDEAIANHPDLTMKERDIDDRLSPEKVRPVIRKVCEDIAEMLIEKNRCYGSSVFCPENVFSACTPLEGIRVRMDDKVKRLRKGDMAGEDTVRDLLGYLVMYLVGQDLGLV